MEIARSVLRELLASRAPHVRRDVSAVSFTLVATVDEGMDVRFGSGDWDDPVLRPLASRLIDDEAAKHIEHATGRQAAIRCAAPFGDASRAVCQVDLGDGWQHLPVRED